MSNRIINFRLNSKTAELYAEYRKKWNILASDSQIFRSGLGILMAMPEAVSGEKIDELLKEREELVAEARKIFEKNPDPRLYEIWEKLMENQSNIENYFTKSTEKFSNVVGDGKAGRKPGFIKKHTPGRPAKRETGSISKL